jgi:hypothetical protein
LATSASAGGTKTADPAGAPGRTVRSATVTYPVSCTNRRKCSFVTGVRSTQNPATVTVRAGASSGWWSSEPIRNVPPGTHAMPNAGAGPGGGSVTGLLGLLRTIVTSWPTAR